MLEDLLDMFRDLKVKVAGLFCRGYITNVDDSKSITEINVTTHGNERKSNQKHITAFGFHAVAPIDSECINFYQDGSKTNSYSLIAFNRGMKPNINIGESVFYSAYGNSIKLSDDGRSKYYSDRHLFYNGIIDSQKPIHVDGLQVITNRQTEILPSSGVIADNARAVNEVIAMLKVHGLHG